MKLFLVYLGGSAPQANIELHDVRFVVGETIEDCYPQLRKQWFGTQKGLHLDSYVQLHHVDGYKIELKSDPSEQSERLYFVNFGGYKQGQLAEAHEFMVCVARSVEEAKALGKQRLMLGTNMPHKDNLYALDDLLTVDMLEGWHVHLHKDGNTQDLVPDWSGYEVIA
ncbi:MULTISPECIES: DUF1543 domain-containing protein [Gammaproteobacteria]|uniref:DUF1543 domain-containing protein n=1 Tax=Gammaproteobacteria TaxID=1236 RepID=UPI000DD04FED|nr:MULTISPECIES: DUF1543 domain-containing protein [Gammaproteobacteria]RTE85793.1 DUF1543 domain-containing protein [Aliidiomarina sp. B3213]TCZ90205.1 DUF1543 domain-containing protein [Lysobacter sp. N42]